MTQFIWDKEINNIEGSKVFFTDWWSVEYSKKSLKYLVTEESKNATELNDLVVENVLTEVLPNIQWGDLGKPWDIALECLKVLQEHNIRKFEFWYIIKWILSKYEDIVALIVSSYNENFNIAVGKAFWTYEGNWSDGCDTNIRMKDVIRLKDS